MKTIYLMAKNYIETRLKGNDIASVIKFFPSKTNWTELMML